MLNSLHLMPCQKAWQELVSIGFNEFQAVQFSRRVHSCLWPTHQYAVTLF